MDINILLCIFFSSGLFVILRLFARYKVDNFQGIVINYFTAAGFSLFSNLGHNLDHIHECLGFFHITLLVGFLFIVVFMLTAKVTQAYGVGVSSVASKLSMVIPITLGLFLYNEGMALPKIAGLILALVAVVVVNIQEKNSVSAKNALLLPVILFIGCGLVDSSIKFTQHHFISDSNRQLFIMCTFGSAGLIGIAKLVYDLAVLKKPFIRNSWFGGLALGACNYYSLFFFIRSFETDGAESSRVFALVNLGVVVLCTVWAVVLFREKINRYKMTGIILSIAAILTLFFA